MIAEKCGHNGGQGIGAGHVCICTGTKGHEPFSGVGHGCSCGALWREVPDPWASHVGRSFTGTMMEDACPCGQAPCGLVDSVLIDPECIQHPWSRGKTVRQMHNAKDCPGVRASE